MTDEEITEIAKQVTEGDWKGSDWITFARFLLEKQKEIDAGICEAQAEQARSAAVSARALSCADAIRSQGK